MNLKKSDVEWTTDIDALAARAADILINEAATAINLRKRFTIALSGGRTPRKIFELLTQSPRREQISWQHWHIFWGDERYVPYDHPESNYGAAEALLLSRVNITRINVHPMPIILGDIDAAAQAYEQILRTSFKGDVFPIFDLMLQGIGVDGHTASLFPGTTSLKESSKLCVPVQVTAPICQRITLTLPVLNAARFILFLASGTEKKAAIGKAITEYREDIPASLVAPKNGRLLWLCEASIKPLPVSFSR